MRLESSLGRWLRRVELRLVLGEMERIELGSLGVGYIETCCELYLLSQTKRVLKVVVICHSSTFIDRGSTWTIFHTV